MADQYRPEAGAPVTAEDAEHRGFATSFRGFDPAEVRAYLRRVADTIRSLQDEQRRLETRAREAERRAEHPNLDEATLAAALGDETARILRSAHEAAAEIRGKAEEHVEAIAQQARDEGARLTAEAANILEVRRGAAEAEAEQIVRSAHEEAERLRNDARADAEQLVAAAAARAEEAVEEARQQRAAVLSDLRRRRRVANTQIEQLRAGRERLIAAYEVVGRTLGEVSDELQRADAEARAAADEVGRRLVASVDPEAVDALGTATLPPFEIPSPPLTDDAAEDVPVAEASEPRAEPVDEPVAAPPFPPPVVITTTPHAGGPTPSRPHRRKARGGRPPAPGSTEALEDPSPALPATVAMSIAMEPAEPAPEPDARPQPKPPAEQRASGVPESEPPPPAEQPAASLPEPAPEPEPLPAPEPLPEPEPRAPAAADALFALLRAEREAAVAVAEDVLRRDPGDPEGDEVDHEPAPVAAAGYDRRLFEARDEACEPLEAHLARRIKRALQDEQNLALDRLRSARGAATIETALGAEADQLAVYIGIVQPALTDAAAAGAAATGANPLAAAGAVDAVAADLASEIVAPLRRRLDERLHEAAAVGDDRATITDRVGAAYRELKAQRVGRLAADWLAVAWASGAYGGTGSGAPRRWEVDPEQPCCTDCDDNALAGPIAAGEPFPTGHVQPPAHPGCRCVLVPAST